MSKWPVFLWCVILGGSNSLAAFLAAQESPAPVVRRGGKSQVPAPRTPDTDTRRLLDDVPAVQPARPVSPQLGAEQGEDLASVDPWASIETRMKAVVQRMNSRDTSQQTQSAQQQIVNELEALIRRLETQRPGQGPQRAGGGQSTTGEPSATAAPTTGKSPLDSAGPTPGKSTSAAAVNATPFRNEFWGHLPDKVRQELRNLSSDQFLPKYERMLEEYYKRLAEVGSASQDR